MTASSASRPDIAIITLCRPDAQESKVLYEWSPSGANKALETLMRHRGMLTDRHQVEHTDVVYTLDLGDSLRGGEDEPDESAL